MTKNEIDNARNPLLKMAIPALERAANNARKLAIFHNTQLVIWQNDRVVKLSPSEIREQSGEYQVD